MCFRWCHIHKSFDPRCVCPLIFLSEPPTGSRLLRVPSVNAQPWRFTNNSLGLPHAHFFSIYLFLCVWFGCVCFLLYLSVYLCCARCVFRVLFHIHNQLFFFFSFSTNSTDTYITVPINVHIALNYIFPARVCVVCVWFLFCLSVYLYFPCCVFCVLFHILNHLFFKFNMHLCHGAYSCTHSLAHMPIFLST